METYTSRLQSPRGYELPAYKWLGARLAQLEGATTESDTSSLTNLSFTSKKNFYPFQALGTPAMDDQFCSTGSNLNRSNLPQWNHPFLMVNRQLATTSIGQ